MTFNLRFFAYFDIDVRFGVLHLNSAWTRKRVMIMAYKPDVSIGDKQAGIFSMWICEKWCVVIIISPWCYSYYIVWESEMKRKSLNTQTLGMKTAVRCTDNVCYDNIMQFSWVTKYMFCYICAGCSYISGSLYEQTSMAMNK